MHARTHATTFLPGWDERRYLYKEDQGEEEEESSFLIKGVVSRFLVCVRQLGAADAIDGASELNALCVVSPLFSISLFLFVRTYVYSI